MNTHHFKICLVGLVSLLASLQIALAASKPQISLFTHSGSLVAEQAKDDPLLLTVSIENTIASEIRRSNLQNQKLLDQYTSTEEYLQLSDKEKDTLKSDYPILEIPAFSLGSNRHSLESLIKVQLHDHKGDLIKSSVRPLASNFSAPSPLALLADESRYFRFVVEPSKLAQLDTGIYYISASINTDGMADMWQGKIVSYPLQLKLKESNDGATSDDLDRKASLNGIYLLYDQQFLNAETAARKWVARKPNSIEAWTQLGESLYGQEKWEQSLEAYQQARQKFWLKYNDSDPRELPQPILDKIRDLKSR